MHGTQVQRGEASVDQGPKPLEENLAFSSYDQFIKDRNSHGLTSLEPIHLEINAEHLPEMLSIGAALIVAERLVAELKELNTPGLSFPFQPILVTLQ